MELRTAKPGEESLISDLAVKVFKPNMKEQFTRLFGVQNIDHMFIGLDNLNIVSSVNYYISQIVSNVGIFKIASIGAVCTDSNYRGKGIASQLLLMAEEKMKCEQIDFCIISGRRGMYKRFGAKDVGAINRYLMEPIESTDLITIQKVEGSSKELYSIYTQEHIKYVREREEFEDLWKAQTYPDSYQTYHTYLIGEDKIDYAYIIVIDHHEKDVLMVKEYAGRRDLVFKSLSKLAKKHHKSQIEIMIPHLDELNRFMRVEKVRITQQATLKIINQISFLDKLNTHLKKMNIKIGYSEKEDLYNLNIEKQTYILDHDQFHLMIFSGVIPESWDMRDQKMIESVFPIELPWSHNLNYQ